MIETANGLTVKQLKFVEYICIGMSYTEAYKKAYNTKNMAQTSIASEGFVLRHHPKIAPLIKSFHNTNIMTAEEGLALMSEVVRDTTVDIGIRMATASKLAGLLGWGKSNDKEETLKIIQRVIVRPDEKRGDNVDT